MQYQSIYKNGKPQYFFIATEKMVRTIEQYGHPTLEQYINNAEKSYNLHKQKNPNYSIPFEDEDLIFVVLDWYSMMGEFTEEELNYLTEVWDIYPDELEALIND